MQCDLQSAQWYLWHKRRLACCLQVHGLRHLHLAKQLLVRGHMLIPERDHDQFHCDHSMRGRQRFCLLPVLHQEGRRQLHLHGGLQQHVPVQFQQAMRFDLQERVLQILGGGRRQLRFFLLRRLRDQRKPAFLRLDLRLADGAFHQFIERRLGEAVRGGLSGQHLPEPGGSKLRFLLLVSERDPSWRKYRLRGPKQREQLPVLYVLERLRFHLPFCLRYANPGQHLLPGFRAPRRLLWQPDLHQ